jgi:hypothetical protein
MRVFVATKEGTVVVDDLPQNATSRDLVSLVLTAKSSDGEQKSSEGARHYLVRDFPLLWPLQFYLLCLDIVVE